MRYERTDSVENPHVLYFSVNEFAIVQASFRENNFYLALRGNPASISDYDIYLAELKPGDSGEIPIRPNNPARIAQVIEEFAERTDDAITAVASQTGTPAYKNTEIGERKKLGNAAPDLAQQIREKTVPKILDTLPELPRDLTDDDLRLLGHD